MTTRRVWIELGGLLEANPQLQLLVLLGCCINNNSVCALAEGLKCHSELKGHFLCGNKIGTNGAKAEYLATSQLLSQKAESV